MSKSKVSVGISLAGSKPRVQRPTMEIAREFSVVGIAEIDRGSSAWDDEGGRDKKGGLVHYPELYPALAIDLVLNEGKGFGSQTISQDDLPSTIDALQEIVDCGFDRPGTDPESYAPPSEVVRDSWRMVYPRKSINKDGKQITVPDTDHPEGRCMVSFRTKNGKGSKPAVVHRDELPKVIELLQSIPDFFEARSEAAWTEYRSVKTAQKEKEAAAAAAKANSNE